MPAYVHKGPSQGPVRDAELHCCMALKHLAACALSGTLRQASRLTGIQNEPFIPKRCEGGQKNKKNN